MESKSPKILRNVDFPQPDDPTIEGEDPEASQQLWDQEELVSSPATYNPNSVLNKWLNSADITDISYALKQSPAQKQERIHRSFKHLTLPDALLLIEQLTQSSDGQPWQATWTYNHQQSSHNKRIFDFKISKKRTIIRHYRCHYDPRLLNIIIQENNKKVGHMKLVIRGKKCEEITGTFKQKKLELDPVFNPKRKNTIREETFRYGKIRATLIYRNNEKKAVLYTKNDQKRLKSKHKVVYKDKEKTVISKQWTLDKRLFQARILFMRDILIPVSGRWKIT